MSTRDNRADGAVSRDRYAETYAKHTFYREKGWTWRCKKPGTSAYAFRVTWAPYALMLPGDVGAIVVNHYSFNDPWSAAAWVNGAGFDYFMEKTEVRKEYSAEATAQFIVEQAYQRLRYDSSDTRLFDRILDAGFGDGDPDTPDGRKSAARALLSGELTAELAYEITNDPEDLLYRYCDSNRWKYAAMRFWAQQMWENEPLWHVALRRWRRTRHEIDDLRRFPILFAPILYAKFRGDKIVTENGSQFWTWKRGKGEFYYAAVSPLKLFGRDLSGIGFYRDRGMRTPDRMGLDGWGRPQMEDFRDVRPEDLKRAAA